MTTFPATAETYVIEVNPQSSNGYTLTPVVGWEMTDKRPLPLTLNGKHTLIGGDVAVLHPGGMVEHPSDGYAFETVEAWLESNPGSGKKHPPAKTTQTPAQQRDEEEMGGSAYDIEWLSKPFKSNSFWRYDDGEYDFVFTVPGGEDIPKATSKVTKIKRDELMALKKEIDLLDLDDIKNAEPLDVEEEFEDDDEDDDDDGGLL